MDLTDLVAVMRARRSEPPGVEVKSGAGGLPASLTETMCAFANLPSGGLIVVGLDESRGFAPVGLRDAATLSAGISSRARQAFDPPVQVSVDVEAFEDADLVIARVHELPASLKPCVVKRTGRAYMRFADGDFELSRLEMDGFIANRSRPRFDEIAVDGATFADLEADRVADLLATARRAERRLARITDDEELLRRVGVVTVAGVPTVAGLLALGVYPQQFLPHCNIRAALLPDGANTSVRALDAATFTGPVAVMLEEAQAWVARNSRRRLVSDRASGRVREELDPPAIAVRELLSNALVHRDLAEWASSRAIELRLDAASLRLTNPGGLYGITADRLGVHPLTSARNRRLVEICKFVRLNDGNVVEALATGIPATLAALRETGMADPDFFDQGIAFTVIVRRHNPDEVSAQSSSSRGPGNEDDVLRVLTGALTVDQISDALGITANAARKRLQRLRSAGLVVLHGGRGTHTTYERTPPE